MSTLKTNHLRSKFTVKGQHVEKIFLSCYRIYQNIGKVKFLMGKEHTKEKKNEKYVFIRR